MNVIFLDILKLIPLIVFLLLLKCPTAVNAEDAASNPLIFAAAVCACHVTQNALRSMPSIGAKDERKNMASDDRAALLAISSFT